MRGKSWAVGDERGKRKREVGENDEWQTCLSLMAMEAQKVKEERVINTETTVKVNYAVSS